MNTFENTKKKLKKYHQEHIITLIENLNEQEKENILKQIHKLDFKQIDRLYQELSKKELEDSKDIEEIVALNKDKLPKEELEHYESLGEKILKNNQYALVTMSGGQGTRLGYNGPKGTFQINIDPRPQYLFEILANKLKEANKKYDHVIPWYIMTSEENNDEIIEFFEKQNYFNYPKEHIKFFKQDNLPLITPEGKLLIGNKKLIKEAANR